MDRGEERKKKKELRLIKGGPLRCHRKNGRTKQERINKVCEENDTKGNSTN
jgi:hypothetical protein